MGWCSLVINVSDELHGALGALFERVRDEGDLLEGMLPLTRKLSLVGHDRARTETLGARRSDGHACGQTGRRAIVLIPVRGKTVADAVWAAIDAAVSSRLLSNHRLSFPMPAAMTARSIGLQPALLQLLDRGDDARRRAALRLHRGKARCRTFTDGVDPFHEYEDVSGGVASNRVKVGAALAYAGEQLGASDLKACNGFGEIVHIKRAVSIRQARPDRRESVEAGVVEGRRGPPMSESGRMSESGPPVPQRTLSRSGRRAPSHGPGS